MDKNITLYPENGKKLQIAQGADIIEISIDDGNSIRFNTKEAGELISALSEIKTRTEINSSPGAENHDNKQQ